jgi:hypothetical protein
MEVRCTLPQPWGRLAAGWRTASTSVVAAFSEVQATAPRAWRAAIHLLGSLEVFHGIEAIRATLSHVHPRVRSEAQAALRRQRLPRGSQGPE